MAALAALAFPFLTAAAHADVMSAGTWEGRITGGTMDLGNGDLQRLAVPAGLPFSFTVPKGATAPVPFSAPGIHVAIPLKSVTESNVLYTAAGELDISPLAGTIDPRTGALKATGSAHGALHLNAAKVGSSTGSSMWCHIGALSAPAGNPAPPAPVALSLSGTGSLAAAPFAVTVDCGDLVAPGTNLKIIGNLSMPAAGNALSLKVVTLPAGRCVVPKLKGLKLKQARKAAKAANCAVGKVKRKKSGRRSTTVLKQGSKAGAVLAEGSRIALTIAR